MTSTDDTTTGPSNTMLLAIEYQRTKQAQARTKQTLSVVVAMVLLWLILAGLLIAIMTLQPETNLFWPSIILTLLGLGGTDRITGLMRK